LRDAPITIQTTYPGSDTEGGIAQALAALTDDLCSRAWHREDSVEMRVDRLLIDSGYQADVVYEAVRRSSHASVMRPSKGMGLRAGDTPMTEWERKQTQRPGYHWCLTVDTNRRRGQLLRYDTNFWKTFLAARIAAPLGNRASLSVYGDRQEQHRMLADHLAAEEPILNEAKGRQVWEWRKIQSGMDNHLLDCLVGCCAAASEVGLSIESTPQAQQAARKVIQFPSHLVRRS
jgi:phage terminase large subunit GpA-like protein